VSSHLINEFRSLCTSVYDAAAFRGRLNAFEAEIPNILNWTDLLISTIIRQPPDIINPATKPVIPAAAERRAGHVVKL